MSIDRCTALALAGLVLALTEPADALLINPSFEDVPSTAVGQGFLPTGWETFATIHPGADTYSEDGSYGLSPGHFNHFHAPFGAADGKRWVAGADFGNGSVEAFGQELATSLIAGESYTLTADVTFTTPFSGPTIAGGWEVRLVAGGTTEALGLLLPSSQLDVWAARSLTFVAPTLSGPQHLVFAPFSVDPGQHAYVGIDGLHLAADATPVPEPGTLSLAGLGLAAAAGVRRRRRRTPGAPQDSSAS